MSETLTEKLTSTPEGMRLYQQERAIQEVTDLVCELLDKLQITRSELARRLGKTRGYVTQFLDGRTNMTMRTISDVFWALVRSVHFSAGPLSVSSVCTSDSDDDVRQFSRPFAWTPQQILWPVKGTPWVGSVQGLQAAGQSLTKEKLAG